MCFLDTMRHVESNVDACISVNAKTVEGNARYVLGSTETSIGLSGSYLGSCSSVATTFEGSTRTAPPEASEQTVSPVAPSPQESGRKRRTHARCRSITGGTEAASLFSQPEPVGSGPGDAISLGASLPCHVQGSGCDPIAESSETTAIEGLAFLQASTEGSGRLVLSATSRRTRRESSSSENNVCGGHSTSSLKHVASIKEELPVFREVLVAVEATEGFNVCNCMLAERCGHCGKRQGLVFGFKGFGLRQWGHEQRCVARLEQQNK